MVPSLIRNRNRIGLWQPEATAALALTANLEGRCRTNAALWRARTDLLRRGFLMGGKADEGIATEHEVVTGAPVIAQRLSPTVPHCRLESLPT